MAELNKLGSQSGIGFETAARMGRSTARALRNAPVKLAEVSVDEVTAFQVSQKALGLDGDVAKMMGSAGMDMSLTSSRFG